MELETTISATGDKVVLVHFLREGKIACMPNLLPKDMSSNRERAAPHMRTDFFGGVTCPLCKKAV